MKNLVASLLILGITSGCMSVEKAERVMRAHPKELADLCNDCFPVKPIEIIKGDTIILVDTVSELVSDTIKVKADCPDGSVVVVDCPPTKTITRFVKTHSTDTVKLRDTAFETVLINERDESMRRRDGWRKAALWGWGILGGLLLILGIRKRLP